MDEKAGPAPAISPRTRRQATPRVAAGVTPLGAATATDATALAGRIAGLAALAEEIAACGACPRLVAWREAAAANPPARFRGERYWARPVPGWGDAAARIVLVGLAPAAHGGNRTGRVFTGDRSGDFLFASLHRAGLASQPTSTWSGDGLELRGVYVAAAVRCAPPANKPTPEERDRCAPFLHRELALLAGARVIVALGAFGWVAGLRAAEALHGRLARPQPRFGHAAEAAAGPYTLLGTFHPSQQNTVTGRLTPGMLDAVLARAVDVASGR
jgi:uracil-DNA glycosylase family 4